MNVLVSFALLTQKTSSLLKEELSKFEEFSFETTDKCSEKLSLIERSFAIHRFMREVQYLPVNDVHVFVSVDGSDRGMSVDGSDRGVSVDGSDRGVSVDGSGRGVSVDGSDRGVSVDGSGRGVSVDGSGRGCVSGWE